MKRLLTGVALVALLAAPTLAAEPEECGSVHFSDVGWSDITATTAVTTTVLQALGYETEVSILSVPVTYAGLAKGDIDVFLGNWMPTMEADLAPHRDAGDVETSVDGTRVIAVLSVGEDEVGRARGELNDDWLGVHGLYVDERHRGRGHGRALMAGLLEAAAEVGATTAWLEVALDNAPAVGLYDALGFRTHHTCRYLAAP